MLLSNLHIMPYGLHIPPPEERSSMFETLHGHGCSLELLILVKRLLFIEYWLRHPYSLVFLALGFFPGQFFGFKTEMKQLSLTWNFYYIAQARLQLAVILLSLLSKCWFCRCKPPGWLLCIALFTTHGVHQALPPPPSPALLQLLVPFLSLDVTAITR